MECDALFRSYCALSLLCKTFKNEPGCCILSFCLLLYINNNKALASLNIQLINISQEKQAFEGNERKTDSSYSSEEKYLVE